VGAGVGPVPFGMRVSLEPVPGVPEFDGKLNDWPGVGAGVGPVPLGTEFVVPVEDPGPPEVEPLEPVLPELPAEPPLEPPPPCPSASETGVSRIAVTNTSVFGCIFLLQEETHRVAARSVESAIGIVLGSPREKVDQALGTAVIASPSVERHLRLEFAMRCSCC
jgi:hypothetical protein